MTDDPSSSTIAAPLAGTLPRGPLLACRAAAAFAVSHLATATARGGSAWRWLQRTLSTVGHPSWWTDLLAWTVLILMAAGDYVPYAFKSGWYYDDWDLYTQARDAGGTWTHQISACSAHVPGGRSLACVYHVTEYDAFGSHRWMYHLWVVVVIVAIACMVYEILKRCRVAWPWALLAAALTILSPVSDSARLWSVAAIGQIVIALQLAGVMLVLAALGRRHGRTSAVLHVVAGALSVLAMATYEIAVPLVALNIVIYAVAFRNRAALIRGAADLGLVVLFLIYRLAVDPADSESGFVVHRSIGADFSRAWLLLRTAWGAWRSIYAPSWVVLVGMLAVLLAAFATALFVKARRPALLGWSVMLVFALVASVLCTLTFVTANDFYIPASYGTFNRLNLPATIPYTLGFVALLGFLHEVLLTSRALRWCGSIAVGVAVIAVGVHQFRVSDTHKGAWETSWAQQKAALAGYRQAMRGLPHHARILGFDTPEWEQGYVPIFAASWDLRGALDYTTHVDPPAALPFDEGSVCAPAGVSVAGAVEMPYAGPTPLFAVSPTRDAAVRVGSQSACQGVLNRWGPSPFWGATGPG